MNELLINNKIKIEDLIYEIRGKQVMLDSDLAKLYQCSNGTKTINQAVKRHINRFPERFMFQLTKEEYYNILRSQVGTLELEQGQYSKYLPYAFTEEGVAMLATILRTSVAEQVSIAIMDAFVEMRRYIKSNNYDKRISNIETKIIEYDNNFKLIFDNFESKVNNDIFFEGQTLNKSQKNKLINQIPDNYKVEDLLGYIVDYNSKKLQIMEEENDCYICIDKTIACSSSYMIIEIIRKDIPLFVVEKSDYESYIHQLRSLKTNYHNQIAEKRKVFLKSK